MSDAPLCKWCVTPVAEWGDICEGHRLSNAAHSTSLGGHRRQGWQDPSSPPEVREEHVLVVTHVVGSGVEADPYRQIQTYYVKRGEGWEPLCERDGRPS